MSPSDEASIRAGLISRARGLVPSKPNTSATTADSSSVESREVSDDIPVALERSSHTTTTTTSNKRRASPISMDHGESNKRQRLDVIATIEESSKCWFGFYTPVEASTKMDSFTQRNLFVTFKNEEGIIYFVVKKAEGVTKFSIELTGEGVSSELKVFTKDRAIHDAKRKGNNRSGNMSSYSLL